MLPLLVAELVALTLPFDASSIFRDATGWIALLLGVQERLRAVFITGIVAIIFLSWPVVRDEFRRVLDESDGRPAKWLPWLAAHLAVLVPLIIGTVARRTGQLAGPAHPGIWLAAWVALALLAVATWGAAVLPPRFWISWLGRSPGAFVAGVAFGFTASLVSDYTQLLLSPSKESTFQAAAALLGLLGRRAVYRPQDAILGTSTFSVHIARVCSGLEGVGLICTFLVAFFWYYRRELRFPQAFLLLPIGAVAVWMLNVVRITLLILLGSWDPEVALKGFHSVAGWLFFNAVALGLVAAGLRVNFLTRIGRESSSARVSNPAAAYLVPMLAIVTTAMVTRAFSAGFDTFYPLRVLAAVGALWFYRRELASMRWTSSWPPVVIGVLVFTIWIALVRDDRASDTMFAAAFGGFSASSASTWLLFRAAGAVITAPIAEELAFRGYLIRKLVDSDFESVAPDVFTWSSFLGSSLLFGAMHGEWVAGTIAGMAFAVALYRRGVLSDAIVAHSTTNALLAAYVLATRSWSLWN